MPNPTQEANPTPTCHACNYSLRGLAQDDATRCPECGASVADAAKIRALKRKRAVTALSTPVVIMSLVLVPITTFAGMALGSSEIFIVAFFIFGPAYAMLLFLLGTLAGMGAIAAFILMGIAAIATAAQYVLYIKLAVRFYYEESSRLRWCLAIIASLHILIGGLSMFLM